MSLKAVHIAFITVATLFSVFFGVWALQQHQAVGGGTHLLLAIFGLAGALGLPIYGAWFLKKMKRVAYL